MQQATIQYGKSPENSAARSIEMLTIAIVLCEATRAKSQKIYTDKNEFLRKIERRSPYGNAIDKPSILTFTTAMSHAMFATSATVTHNDDGVFVVATYAGLYIELLFDHWVFNFDRVFENGLTDPNDLGIDMVHDLFYMSSMIEHGTIHISAAPAKRVIKDRSQGYITKKLAETPFFVRVFDNKTHEPNDPALLPQMLVLYIEHGALMYISFRVAVGVIDKFAKKSNNYYIRQPEGVIETLVDNLPYYYL